MASFLMDASNLCPDGFSFFYRDLTPMQSGYAKMRKRSSVETPKYYFADFKNVCLCGDVRGGTDFHADDIFDAGYMLRQIANVSSHYPKAIVFLTAIFLVLFYRFRVYGYTLESDV
jgi:hypothetical protein